MSTKPNNRSDAALHERLELAEKATQGPWKSDEVVTRKKDFEPSYVVKDKDGFTIVDVIPVSAYQANAAHIAASSPDVVRADIEEILRLRQEVARLELENQRLAVDGVNDESYLLTCLDIIRKAVGMPVGSDWQQVAERVERLDKETDWLVKILLHYTEDCPLKFSWVYEEMFPIPKIDGCDGSWPDDDYFDCSNSTPEKCWREAARKAVEENERYG